MTKLLYPHRNHSKEYPGKIQTGEEEIGQSLAQKEIAPSTLPAVQVLTTETRKDATEVGKNLATDLVAEWIISKKIKSSIASATSRRTAHHRPKT